MRNFIVMVCLLMLTICGGLVVNPLPVVAQPPLPWSRQQQIPNFDPETEPPVLVADQNRTVHAFSSQAFDDDDSGSGGYGIYYNQWALQKGWTKPNNILLSPLYNDARVMGVVLDPYGIFHLVFVGGQEIEAHVYYSQAAAIEADNANKWSPPIVVGDSAITPRSVGLVLDDNRLVMLYAGNRDGMGIYSVYSTDFGNTWSDPVPVFLTDNAKIKPYFLVLTRGQSGWLHATWNVVTDGGQGRGIYYAHTRFENGQYTWEQPTTLATAAGGLGAMTPTIIEHQNVVFSVYNMTPKLMMRRSTDYGVTWTDPVQIFERHVGVNGTLSLTSDTNKTLHLFFGQRITGNPDIHGMWHSTWLGGRWSEPDPVVSGPQVSDFETDTAFDPYDARAIVSQGNAILVTWRSDPGNKGNGVWYSYATVDAPELPIAALPRVMPTPILMPVITALPPTATPEPGQTAVPANGAGGNQSTQVSDTSPAMPVIVGLAPVLIILGFVTMQSFRQQRR